MKIPSPRNLILVGGAVLALGSAHARTANAGDERGESKHGEGKSCRPPRGVVAHWSFDEGVGTVAHDRAGAVHDDATFVGGPTWVDGVHGTALYFNGVDARLEAPMSADLVPTNEISLAAWVKADAFTNETYLSTQFLVSAFYFEGYYLRIDHHAVAGFDGIGWLGSPQNSIPEDRWVHLCGVYEPGQALGRSRLYLDGKLAAEGFTCAGGCLLTEAPPVSTLTIGSFLGGELPFKGALDEVYIFNRTLTAAECGRLARLPGGHSDDEADLTHDDEDS